MSSDIAIKVENLSKCYQIYDTPRDRLKQFLVPPLCRLIPGLRRYFPTPDAPVPVYHREFWALKDVSFEIKKGETVGIIGRNGSGKSTLLQLICGTLNPTAGAITVNGRIAALLELGSGFNPEFTGRENVRLTCALLGLTPEETDQRFEEIAAFADIGDFIEQPVKTYSSGMFVRLAFAANILANPQIMVVDEALAVGDMNFQAKCLTALKRLQKNGASVLLVTHDINAIKNLCSRALYLQKGVVKKIGHAPEIVEYYEQDLRLAMNAEIEGKAVSTELKENEFLPIELKESCLLQLYSESDCLKDNTSPFRYGSGAARIRFVDLLDSDGEPTRSLKFNQKVKIKICFVSYFDGSLSCNYYIEDSNKNMLIGADPGLITNTYLQVKAGNRYAVVYETELPLHEGKYSIKFELTKPLLPILSAEFLDVVNDYIVFTVERRPEKRLWASLYLSNSIKFISFS